MVVAQSAVLSGDGVYRYQLSRTWNASLPKVTFIMLNPSTADAAADDPTIRRCIGFAKYWEMGGIVVGNLFAVRATQPAAMKMAADPVGPDNAAHLERICRTAALSGGPVVAAWGAHGNHMKQDETFLGWCWEWDVEPQALRLTKSGAPAHPLYLPYNCVLTAIPMSI
jgi:hypothetical protein